MDRFDRIFELNRLLQAARNPVSRRKLQEALEWSRATVKRLIEEVRLYLSAPVVYDRPCNLIHPIGDHVHRSYLLHHQEPAIRIKRSTDFFRFNASRQQALLSGQLFFSRTILNPVELPTYSMSCRVIPLGLSTLI